MTIGIYALYWAEQDLIYIGQSQNIESRYKEHTYKMSKNTHTNYKVQDAYNKYGNPELVIIEKCSIGKLNELEVYWTNDFDSINNGLNIIEAGTVGWGVNSNASKYTKWQILKVFSLLYRTNLSQNSISTKIGISKSLINDISCGKSHLWLKYKYPVQYRLMLDSNINKRYRSNSNNYTLLSPANIKYTIDGSIRKFCRELGLDNSEISKLLRGKKSSYKGWTTFSSK